MASRMRGYDDAQAHLIFRDLIDMPADVAISDAEVRVRFHRRAHLPSSSPPGSSTNRLPSPGGTANLSASSSTDPKAPALGQFRSVEIQAR
jgi:hypothetical protein